MTVTQTALETCRKPLYAAIVGGMVLFSYTTGIQAEIGANPTAVAKPMMLAAACNPCAAKKACNPCNPCAAKKACNPCNPCAAKKACNPCNPCAAKKACNPCNPCAAKKACNPCNPCAAKSACGACNPCGVAKGPKMLVSGVLVDTRCYGFDNSNVGNTHKMGGANVPGCATACAKMGIPVAILDGGTSGGQLYTIASPAPGFADYMGMQARMSGTEIISGLMLPQQLEVKTASGWKKVNIKGMM